MRTGRGAILNVSSIASIVPVPKLAVYSATKAYVTSFSEALRAELRGTGVSVTAVCPGPVDTEFFDQAERGNPEDSAPAPEVLKISMEEVVSTALDAVARDRARVIPGWLVWATMTAAALVPMAILRLFLAQRRSNS